MTYTVSLQTGASCQPIIRQCFHRIDKKYLPEQIESMVQTAIRLGYADYFRIVVTGD